MEYKKYPEPIKRDTLFLMLAMKESYNDNIAILKKAVKNGSESYVRGAKEYLDFQTKCRDVLYHNIEVAILNSNLSNKINYQDSCLRNHFDNRAKFDDCFDGVFNTDDEDYLHPCSGGRCLDCQLGFVHVFAKISKNYKLDTSIIMDSIREKDYTFSEPLIAYFLCLYHTEPDLEKIKTRAIDLGCCSELSAGCPPFYKECGDGCGKCWKKFFEEFEGIIKEGECK